MADLYDVHNARFQQPTADDIDGFLKEQFNVSDTPQDGHDPTNPEHVTRELMKPFPPSALYTRDMWQPGGGKKKLTYVQYQQVIRRLIHATGNRFHIRVLSTESTPWGTSKNGNALAMVSAIVELEIPALNSSRAATGVQVVTVGSGEDMYKGAVSDGVKKAAQAFGVAIDLAGADGEDIGTDPVGLPHRGTPVQDERASSDAPRRLSQVQSPQPPQHAPQGGAQRPAGGSGPRTDQQGRALWKISNGNRDLIAEWCAPYGVTSDRDLTEAQAAEILAQYGGGNR